MVCSLFLDVQFLKSCSVGIFPCDANNICVCLQLTYDGRALSKTAGTEKSLTFQLLHAAAAAALGGAVHSLPVWATLQLAYALLAAVALTARALNMYHIL